MAKVLDLLSKEAAFLWPKLQASLPQPFEYYAKVDQMILQGFREYKIIYVGINKLRLSAGRTSPNTPLEGGC